MEKPKVNIQNKYDDNTLYVIIDEYGFTCDNQGNTGKLQRGYYNPNNWFGELKKKNNCLFFGWDYQIWKSYTRIKKPEIKHTLQKLKSENLSKYNKIVLFDMTHAKPNDNYSMAGSIEVRGDILTTLIDKCNNVHDIKIMSTACWGVKKNYGDIDDLDYQNKTINNCRDYRYEIYSVLNKVEKNNIMLECQFAPKNDSDTKFFVDMDGMPHLLLRQSSENKDNDYDYYDTYLYKKKNDEIKIAHGHIATPYNFSYQEDLEINDNAWRGIANADGFIPNLKHQIIDKKKELLNQDKQNKKVYEDKVYYEDFISNPPYQSFESLKEDLKNEDPIGDKHDIDKKNVSSFLKEEHEETKNESVIEPSEVINQQENLESVLENSVVMEENTSNDTDNDEDDKKMLSEKVFQQSCSTIESQFGKNILTDDEVEQELFEKQDAGQNVSNEKTQESKIIDNNKEGAKENLDTIQMVNDIQKEIDSDIHELNLCKQQLEAPNQGLTNEDSLKLLKNIDKKPEDIREKREHIHSLLKNVTLDDQDRKIYKEMKENYRKYVIFNFNNIQREDFRIEMNRHLDKIVNNNYNFQGENLMMTDYMFDYIKMLFINKNVEKLNQLRECLQDISQKIDELKKNEERKETTNEIIIDTQNEINQKENNIMENKNDIIKECYNEYETKKIITPSSNDNVAQKIKKQDKYNFDKKNVSSSLKEEYEEQDLQQKMNNENNKKGIESFNLNLQTIPHNSFDDFKLQNIHNEKFDNVLQQENSVFSNDSSKFKLHHSINKPSFIEKNKNQSTVSTNIDSEKSTNKQHNSDNNTIKELQANNSDLVQNQNGDINKINLFQENEKNSFLTNNNKIQIPIQKHHQTNKQNMLVLNKSNKNTARYKTTNKRNQTIQSNHNKNTIIECKVKNNTFKNKTVPNKYQKTNHNSTRFITPEPTFNQNDVAINNIASDKATEPKHEWYEYLLMLIIIGIILYFLKEREIKKYQQQHGNTLQTYKKNVSLCASNNLSTIKSSLRKT